MKLQLELHLRQRIYRVGALGVMGLLALVVGLTLLAVQPLPRQPQAVTSADTPHLDPGELSSPQLIAQGEAVAQQRCAKCHDLSPGRNNQVGPYLWGVVGRPAASGENYNYSTQHRFTARAYNVVWDLPTLDAYLRQPDKLFPNNAMAKAFTPMDDPDQRKALLAFLGSLH